MKKNKDQEKLEKVIKDLKEKKDKVEQRINQLMIDVSLSNQLKQII